MPRPKATGTQGSNRPAPASARTQLRRVSTSGDQALRPDGANGPACAAPRGGQVPATPCVRPLLLPGSAIQLRASRSHLRAVRLPEAVIGEIVERNQNFREQRPTSRRRGQKKLSALTPDFLRKSVTQADGPVEHRTLRRRIRIAHE